MIHTSANPVLVPHTHPRDVPTMDTLFRAGPYTDPATGATFPCMRVGYRPQGSFERFIMEFDTAMARNCLDFIDDVIRYVRTGTGDAPDIAFPELDGLRVIGRVEQGYLEMGLVGGETHLFYPESIFPALRSVFQEFIDTGEIQDRTVLVP